MLVLQAEVNLVDVDFFKCGSDIYVSTPTPSLRDRFYHRLRRGVYTVTLFRTQNPKLRTIPTEIQLKVSKRQLETAGSTLDPFIPHPNSL